MQYRRMLIRYTEEPERIKNTFREDKPASSIQEQKAIIAKQKQHFFLLNSISSIAFMAVFSVSFIVVFGLGLLFLTIFMAEQQLVYGHLAILSLVGIMTGGMIGHAFATSVRKKLNKVKHV
jgi:hypothetical protein